MIKKFVEPTMLQLARMSHDELLDAYEDLRAHHIAETTEPQAGGPGMTFEEVKESFGIVAFNKGPSVLVVGPDGVGKTTLVRKMSKITGIPSFKCPVEKRIFREGGRQSLTFDYMLIHFLEQTGFRFISDRAYPCEFVYSQVFDRATDLDLLLEIDLKHQNIGTQILYLYSSVQPAEPDDIVPPERYWDVKRGYDHFVEWTDCQVTAVDTAEMIGAYRDGGDRSEEFARVCLERMGVK